MRMIWSLFASMLSLSAFSLDVTNGFPDGNYWAAGTWQDNVGNAGEYSGSLSISNNEISVEYKFGGTTVLTVVGLNFLGNGLVDVISADEEKLGEGWCQANQCNFKIEIAGIPSEETFVFGDDGTIEKYGSKTVGDRVYTWNERLTVIADEDPAIPSL